MKKAICMLAALPLVACIDSGGSSGSSPDPTDNPADPTTPNPPQSANVINGVLVDPYIADAKVCLDLNENQRCDTDEPTATTDANGEFEFTLDAALSASAQVILLNRGSFQSPNYGYHEGMAYELPLMATVAAGENQIVITPASTAQVLLNVDGATLAAIVNQFSDVIGRTLTAADLEGNPFSDLAQSSIDQNAVAVLRANLALYSILRTLTALESVAGYEDMAATFAADAQDANSATYQLVAGVMQTIAAGIDESVLTSIQNVIDTGNQTLQDSLPSGISAPDMPDLSTEVVMSTAVAIADAFISEAVSAVIDGLDTVDSSKTFAENYAVITQSVVTKMQALKDQTTFSDLVLSLGTKTYASVNRSHFAAYIPQIRQGIFSANAELQAGYECEAGHFSLGFVYNQDFTDVESVAVCTSAEPAEISEQLGDYHGEEDVPVDENIWANLPIGRLRVSDQQQGCTFQGIVKDESDAPLAFVPMYFAYPPLELEMYVQTNASGEFQFTHVPLNVGDYAADQFFFGTYAGARGPHTQFQNKEAVSDFNIRCENNGDVYAFNPVMKDIVDGTVLTGTVDTELIGDGFRIEISAAVGANNPLFTRNEQTGLVDRAWIMESIEDETHYNHPHMDFNTATGEFTVRKLAGGDYKFRVVVGASGEGETLRPEFEFDLNPADDITIPAGESVSVQLAFDEENQTYTLTGGGASGVATSYADNIN